MENQDNDILKILKFHNKLQTQIYPLDKKWKHLTYESIKNFNKKKILKKIKNFRNKNFLINDLYPSTFYANLNIRTLSYLIKNLNFYEILNFLKERLPSSIQQRKLQKQIIKILEKIGCSQLLKEFDISKTAGMPFYFEYKNYKFNMRWLRYIFFIKLYEDHIKTKLKKKKHLFFIDIGGAYGAFSELLKRKQPNSTNIIIDFPNQLTLAYYYLKSFKKKYSVGTMFDIKKNIIDENSIKNFDFFLLPSINYKNLKIKKVDLITNFFSFGEMKTSEMQSYFKSDVYKKTNFIFLSNRIFSNPNKALNEKKEYKRNSTYYDTTTTINDYNLNLYKKIYFDKNPVYPYLIRNKKIFFYEKLNISSDYFDFIGEKK